MLPTSRDSNFCMGETSMSIYVNKHKRFDEVYPYTYVLKHKETGLKYHGVRFANVKQNRSPNDDFAVHYFTSSGTFKEHFINNPDEFSFYIKWSFDSIEDALNYEETINRKLIYSDKWVNQRTNKATILSEDAINKISKSSIDRWRDDEFKDQHSNFMKDKWKDTEYRNRVSLAISKKWEDVEYREHMRHMFKNKTVSDETKEKLSNINTGTGNPMYGKTSKYKGVVGENHFNYGKTWEWSEEAKLRYSKKCKERPKIECENCHKYLDKANYSRWHGTKCKHNKANK